MMKKTGFFLLAIILLMSCSDKSGKLVMPNDRSAFVTLTDAVPDAILEIRYFSTYNFVGTRIDGYEEPTALLTPEDTERLISLLKAQAAAGKTVLVASRKYQVISRADQVITLENDKS